MLIRLLLFLVLNFSALAIGGFFAGKGVGSDWYAGLSKAPWTPPGWVFGFAWTSIMICYSLYMAYLWPRVVSVKERFTAYSLQWILNVLWNPVFFYFHFTGWALLDISVLTILIAFFFIGYHKTLKWKSILLLPYLLWLLIATSLNAYIVLWN